MSDPRKVPVTITLTAEEWDSLGFGLGPSDYEHRRYASRGWASSSLRAKAHEAIVNATPGAEERARFAREEFRAKLPVLDQSAKRVLRRQLDRLLAKHSGGILKVDHLGHGQDDLQNDSGFHITLIPHTAPGGPALHFARQGSAYFAGEEEPLTADERAWFLKLVRSRRRLVDHWGTGAGVSARFK